MSEKREEYIVTGYDNAKGAYIIEYKVNGVFYCSFNAYLNHRTRTFKCYPRTVRLNPPKLVFELPENEVINQPKG